jgi:molybdopterin molybdotransferase
LRAIEIGLLAEVGAAEVAVTPRPRVAILPTGDELVDVRQTPSAGQVRNSNGPLLAAAVAGAGGEAWPLGLAPDERKRLSELVAQGLEADVLLLSGGVSAGVLDLVPEVLAAAGVRRVFHRVRLRPGKPLWFGVCEHAVRRTLVFGLPGNPVSSLVGFELFVRPALEALSGCVAAKDDARNVSALLSQPYTHRGDRPTYQPAQLLHGPDGLRVTPLPWQGSADLRALVAADCLACFPAGDRAYEVGERMDVLLLR